MHAATHVRLTEFSQGQSGVRAALMARGGFMGPRTVLDGEHGLYRAFAPSAAPDFGPFSTVSAPAAADERLARHVRLQATSRDTARDDDFRFSGTPFAPHAGTTMPQQSTVPPTPLDRTPQAALRALVIDDDHESSRLLATRLLARGFKVDDVKTSEDALARLREAPPDLAFLDVEMPGISGLDVLASIREDDLDMAVIMTTEFGSEEIAIQALRCGADDYLRKPFDRADFQQVLERTVARLQLSRQNAALRRQNDEQHRQIEQELARAAQVQAELLPHEYPRIPGFEIAAACLPAHEVGGDFYDWQQLPSGLLSLTVGDVMGKGLSAALLMTTVRAVLRALVVENRPAEAVQRTASALDGDLERSGTFVTLFHAQLDADRGRLRYVDAGHGYVVLRRADGTVVELKPWGLPLGVDSSEIYHEGSVDFAMGDTLVIYSDGLTEARPDLFADRLTVASQAARGADAVSIVCQLIDEATQIKPLPDDLTVVVVRRKVADPEAG
jgi:serine phosphatase RsbU (regulator of sigma subunit)